MFFRRSDSNIKDKFIFDRGVYSNHDSCDVIANCLKLKNLGRIQGKGQMKGLQGHNHGLGLRAESPLPDVRWGRMPDVRWGKCLRLGGDCKVKLSKIGII